MMAIFRSAQPESGTVRWTRNMLAPVMVLVFSTTAVLAAEEVGNGSAAKAMSQDELIKLALSAAPTHIAKDAAVMLQGEDGKLIEVRKGSKFK
jgi:hypothetical protein